MGNEWPLVKLGDFVQILTGHPFKSKDYTEHEGIRLLRGDNIAQGTLRWQNVKLLPQEKIGEKEHNYFLRTGDVILAMDRPWIEAGLKTAQINENDLPCLLVQRVACLRCEDPSDQDFIRYIISSYGFVQYVKLIQTGTAVPHISGKQIKDYEFRLPPKSVRKQIGRIVKQLDDKANLNRQINQTLEQMAQTLFKSWFVDFDPVMDNALDAGNPIPDELQHRAEARKAVRESEDFKPLPDDVRQLFPDAFEESELGWVPKGWGVTRLENILELAYGKALTKTDRVDGKYPVYGSGGVNGTHKTYLVKGPGIIVGRKGTVGSLHWERNHFFPIDTVFYVKPHIGYSLTYCFYLLKTLGLETMNTDAAVPGLNRNNAYRLKCVIPSEEVREHLTKTLTNGRKKMDACLENIETLSKLRDELLPKLISGDIKIGDSF